MKYAMVDLFSGSGGISLGFRLSGHFEPIVAIDTDTNSANTYEVNLGAPAIRKSVALTTSNEILAMAVKRGYERVDVVVGGAPCQPFSRANRGETRWERQVATHTESSHQDWTHFLRLVSELQPKAVLAENVMGIRVVTDVLSSFQNGLRALGYSCTARKLTASNFGVPQNRARVFVAALLGEVEDDRLLPRDEKKTECPNVDEAIGDLPRMNNDASAREPCKYRPGRPSHYQSVLRSHNDAVFDHVAHSVHPAMARRFRYVPPGRNLVRAWRDGLVPEEILQAHYVRGRKREGFSKNTLQNAHSNIYRRLDGRKPSCTITHVRRAVLIHPHQNRLLSVREAARLQSFPDSFVFTGSLSSRYQQVANAVPPFLAKAIAQHISKLMPLATEPGPLRLIPRPGSLLGQRLAST